MKEPLSADKAGIPDAMAAFMNSVGPGALAGALKKSFAGAAVMDTNVLDQPGDTSFDLHPSAAICKGERDLPFTISWHSQKELVQTLAWKSTLYIGGGPVLAIASFYFLLVSLEFISY